MGKSLTSLNKLRNLENNPKLKPKPNISPITIRKSTIKSKPSGSNFFKKFNKSQNELLNELRPKIGSKNE
jgi:hypothetical protein